MPEGSSKNIRFSEKKTSKPFSEKKQQKTSKPQIQTYSANLQQKYPQTEVKLGNR